ncbi:sporulation-specific diadenylate cyclase CdaS [Scopulibacillus cellulosilyticus]|uniref:Diadenylate cyclase n=1 Tax=Scopulibacillus cellulosilyticus TaxID=2665665 RepID=A0ABW2PU83_9BACL
MAQEQVGLNSTMRHCLKENIHRIMDDMQSVLESVDCNEDCILQQCEHIQEVIGDLQKKAASYYLKSYLSPYTDGYPSITTAVEHLSDRHHGALIVIQREDSLDGLIHPGIPVGATLTYSLLESIFYPGSPLHDGAVLIQEDSIISAANVLPLSRIQTGERKLGTRHRAAVGLSEVCDAIILVVSEETGKASFAVNGKLYAFHSKELYH